jgi:hypothetical protein
MYQDCLSQSYGWFVRVIVSLICSGVVVKEKEEKNVIMVWLCFQWLTKNNVTTHLYEHD